MPEPRYSISSEQEDFLREFANKTENLKYHHMVLYDMPHDWQNMPCRDYSDAQNFIDEQMPSNARNAQIINLMLFWEG